MKTEFFVRAATPVRVAWKEADRVRGDRFDMDVTVVAEKLDRDGFVMDFERLQRVVFGIRDSLEQQRLDEILTDGFSPRGLLDLVVKKLDEALDERVHIKSVWLKSTGEGFGIELD